MDAGHPVANVNLVKLILAYVDQDRRFIAVSRLGSYAEIEARLSARRP